jgi:DmsE family decaheme c-type cytochrome
MSRFHRKAPALWIGGGFAIWLLAVAIVPARAGSVDVDKASPAKATAAKTSQTPAPSAAEYVGEETCLTCHEDSKKGYHGSAHARALDPRSPAAAAGCESCHGPGQAHVEAGGTAGTIKKIGGLEASAVNETCLTCHNRGAHAAWEGSAHDARNMSCTSCHSVHEPKSAKAALTKATEAETCATCHQDKSAKMKRSAHMPVREGKMECSSCHNAHGSVSNVRLLRTGTTVNESCQSCHTDKRGPFLYEHAPTSDNCATCHDPHGSNNERMLVAKQPMLCQRCHIHARHPATIYDSNAMRTATGGGSNRAFNRSCVQCHQTIHGTNHPAGVFFVR